MRLVLVLILTAVAAWADDPGGRPKSKEIDFATARRHWAYQPIHNSLMPSVHRSAWPTSPIDVLILAKLEANGMTPSSPADRRTLIRRAYHDLIGLPPTFEEVDAFEQDATPDAFARVVDRLLASPHHGERWGRHWLDVARYADTKDGVLMFGVDRIRPYAYTYRDYVTRALNEDLPYSQFIHHQLAADQMNAEPWQLAAMGFLTLGRMFDNNVHDIYDDQIDTVTRALLGLTVSCARCHDHKYDAIPTADYYSLYGVFASSEAPLELPLVAELSKTPDAAEYEKKAAPLREKLRQHVDAQYAELTETARLRVPDYLLKIVTEKPDPLETTIYFLSLSPEDLRPQITARWRRYLESHARAENPVFGPWAEMMDVAEERLTDFMTEAVARWQAAPPGVARGQLNPLVKAALTSGSLTDRAAMARRYGELLQQVYRDSKEPRGRAEETEAAARQQLLAILTSRDGPTYFPKSHAYLYMARVERETYHKLQRELDKLAVVSPNAPPRAMVLNDSPELHNPRVLVRGNPTQPGESVPRQFLRILVSGPRQAFTAGSGRLDLARAITAPDNPLTSRVMVNRVWMHHFGEPLVQTPSDFGTRGSPPSHPELLDYLAWTFQQDGWSLKKLHRRIMLSSTYQQASFDRPACRQVDPENRLLWRANRRRLDLESMRDSLLAISGRLDRTLGGRPVDISGDAQNRRRTIYGQVDRQDLPGHYRAFDFANPDQTVERRPQTTVPQQALFGLNSPFVIEQAKALAARPEISGEAAADRRVAALYRLVLLREPEPAEIQSALSFLAAEPDDSRLTPWEQYAQALLLTNEAMFID
jgi:hypothetical protein